MVPRSRFSAVSRRALLQGVSTTALLGLVGCATDDSAILNPTTATSTSALPATAAAGQLSVSFSYTVDNSAAGGGPGGMVRNPYIAVWVEDPDGKLVRTISLWHLQNGQDRWLSELHRWYSASGGVDTTSSATRAAGSYAVAWDLNDVDGNPVANGQYTLCVEATREHGPYSLVTGSIEVTGKAIKQELPASGELSAVAIAFRPT